MRGDRPAAFLNQVYGDKTKCICKKFIQEFTFATSVPLALTAGYVHFGNMKMGGTVDAGGGNYVSYEQKNGQYLELEAARPPVRMRRSSET